MAKGGGSAGGSSKGGGSGRGGSKLTQKEQEALNAHYASLGVSINSTPKPVNDHNDEGFKQAQQQLQGDSKAAKGTAKEQLVALDSLRNQNQAKIEQLPQGLERQFRESEQARLNQQRSSLMSASQREDEFAGGLEQGKKIIGDGSLGRVNTNLDRLDTSLGRVDTSVGRIQEGQFDEGNSANVNEVLEMRRKALLGMSTEEANAKRDIALQNIARGEQLQARQLSGAQAQAGLRGASAVAQHQQVMQSAQVNRASFERDLFLANEGIKREALNSFEQSVTQSEQDQFRKKSANIELSQFNLAQQLKERELQQFNLSQQFNERNLQQANLQQQQAERQLDMFNLQQAAKEKFGQVSVAMGSQQLGTSERSAAAAAQIASQGSGGGGKVLCTMFHELGYISSEVYRADELHGNRVALLEPELIRGYHFWAKPLVKFSRNKPLMIKILKPFVLNWANSMYEDREPWFIIKVGKVVSKLIGKIIGA